MMNAPTTMPGPCSSGVHPVRRLLLAGVLCAPAACLLAAPAAGAQPSDSGLPMVLAQKAPDAPVERLRKIPTQAREGVMSPPDGRTVTIDRNRFTLAPGALIRDLHNRIVLPSHVREPATVRYTIDRNRQISEIWIVAENP